MSHLNTIFEVEMHFIGIQVICETTGVRSLYIIVRLQTPVRE